MTILLFCSGLIDGQTIQFKKYTNQVYKLSFDIPNYWAIKYSKLQNGVICVPVTNQENEIYRNCFEGIVFRINFYRTALDSALINEGSYTKTGDTYYTSDRFSDSIKAKNINGKNWKGIYHRNVCGISCKENGFHAAAGQCDFLYLSNGSTTICINTNGRQFDNKVLKRLISSFKFN
ncbi:MAG: hypothetical protein ABI863_09500 [Ginsengibacter sp.]